MKKLMTDHLMNIGAHPLPQRVRDVLVQKFETDVANLLNTNITPASVMEAMQQVMQEAEAPTTGS